MMCNKTVFRIVQRLVISGNPTDRRILVPGVSAKGYSSSRHHCSPISTNYAHYNMYITKQGFSFLYNAKRSLQIKGVRFYCSKKDHHELPQLMEFPQVVWPNMFKTFRNWILSNFIIARYFDHEFNLSEFVIGSKKAVELVSGVISRGDVESLKGLVTPEVISMVRQSLNTFTLKQQQQFSIKAEDIYFTFPYEVGVMFPNEDAKFNEPEQSQSRFVEITMCYHAIVGLSELRQAGVEPPMNLGLMPEYQDRIFICNYRFIREFTKGVQDDWTINAINHFKPAVQLSG